MFSPDSRFVLGQYHDEEEGNLWGLFDVTTGALIQKFKGDNPRFTPDGKRLAMVFRNNNYCSRLYDTTTGQRIEQFQDYNIYRSTLSEKQTKFLLLLEKLFGKEKVNKRLQDINMILAWT